MPKRKFNQVHSNALTCFFFLCFIFTLLKSTIAQPVLSLTPVIDTGLSAPIQFVHAGDSSKRVFIVQQGGTVRAYDSAFNFLSQFIKVSGITVGGERGLLSMAFHPGYKTNGIFYVYYVNSGGNLELARYHVSSDPDVADSTSKVVLLTIPHPGNSNHNGGELHFGNDGYLYLSTGDGGGAGDVPNNAQNTAVLLGKMLRFDVNTSATPPFYTVPAGNPYGNEIFDLGLRNPFRWSFDRLTHDMWIGDVGQDSWEEINYRQAGSTGGVNYGWHCYEGNVTYNTSGCGPSSSYVFPVYTYATQNPAAAITGGIVYRGTEYPTLQGYYISADFFSGIFYETISNGSGGWTTTTQTVSPTGIVDFGESETGEAYAISITEGTVYRIAAAGPLPQVLVDFNASPATGGVILNWQTAIENNTKQFEVEYSLNGTSFNFLASINARNVASGARYAFLHPATDDGAIFYRLKIIDGDGSYTYSGIVRVFLQTTEKNIVFPSVISDGLMNVNLGNGRYKLLELMTMNGARVLKQNITGKTGQVKIPVGHPAYGIYSVKLTSDGKNIVQKIIIR